MFSHEPQHHRVVPGPSGPIEPTATRKVLDAGSKGQPKPSETGPALEELIQAGGAGLFAALQNGIGSGNGNGILAQHYGVFLSTFLGHLNGASRD